MRNIRIMIAQDAKVMRATRDALKEYDPVVVTNMQAAQRRVKDDDIALFVIGTHFDESRAIELVSIIRSQAKHKKTPIIFVRLLPTTWKDILDSTVVSLIKTGTISLYLELEGDPAYTAKIQAAASSLLPVHQALPD